jgi:hypothetical protein
VDVQSSSAKRDSPAFLSRDCAIHRARTEALATSFFMADFRMEIRIDYFRGENSLRLISNVKAAL